MKLIADEMLGKLSKWLRFIGYDTEYFSGGPDAELLLQAKSEGRIILTRDYELFMNSKQGLTVVFIRFDKLKDQLSQIKNELNLMNLSEKFQRCSQCNRTLSSVEKDFVKGMIPPYILKTKDEFKYCDHCRKVYWSGSHSKHINDLIEEIFNE